MAKKPKNSKNGETPAPERDLEQEMLMREVDEAVRTDQVGDALKNYGLPVGVLLVLGLAAFGGYLMWSGSQEEDLERQSEIVVQAIDEMEANNLSVADQELSTVDGEVSPGALASANMLRAAIALREGRTSDAVGFYDRVVRDENAPQQMRDASLVRMISANYDNMDSQAVIDQLGPLASPDNAWYGSAGELVAHAYLDQERVEQAGPLLVQIALAENVPESIKLRVRQLAGRYGYDAIEDVDDALESLVAGGAEDGAGAAQ